MIIGELHAGKRGGEAVFCLGLGWRIARMRCGPTSRPIFTALTTADP